ncbi:MAG: ABC transporter permease, partial [Candidatus Limnocylindria bacterium]
MARATRVSGEASGIARVADRGRPRRRPRQLNRATIVALQIGFGLSLLGLWEFAARVGMISTRHFSYPSEVFQRILSMALGEQLHGRTVYEHLLATGQALGIGFLIGGSVAVVLGFVLGRSRLINRVFEPYFLAIYSIPKIALAPLFVLLFGIDLESKIAVVILGVFFMVFFSTLAGVMNLSEEYVQIARIMGASRSQVTRRIIVPAALPSIMLGMK